MGHVYLGKSLAEIERQMGISNAAASQ